MQKQYGLVTFAQLVQHGLTNQDVRRLLAAESLIRLRHGVYVDAQAWLALDPFRAQPLLRVRAAALTIEARPYAFSHDSASLALGMGSPHPETALAHISRPKVHGDAVRAGVKHHLAAYRDDDVVEAHGLRVLGPARTALDMAREHGRVAGLAACDVVLRLGCTREELADVLARMRCWPGNRTVRWCIEMADAGAESYLESQGRDLVLELGIGRPETQFGLTDGHRTAYCDLRVARHVFEVDGGLKYAEQNLTGDTPRVTPPGETAPGLPYRLQTGRLEDHRCRRGLRAEPGTAQTRTGVRRHLRTVRYLRRRPGAVPRPTATSRSRVSRRS